MVENIQRILEEGTHNCTIMRETVVVVFLLFFLFDSVFIDDYFHFIIIILCFSFYYFYLLHILFSIFLHTIPRRRMLLILWTRINLTFMIYYYFIFLNFYDFMISLKLSLSITHHFLYTYIWVFLLSFDFVIFNWTLSCIILISLTHIHTLKERLSTIKANFQFI